MTFNAIPVAAVTLDDIDGLCRDGVPESESIEFKQTLPAGGADRWADNAQLVDRARNRILEEVIAFANAHGGRVIIGLSQTDDLPPRANEITALPNCHDLAERLAHAARDVVSPQIPLLSVVGVSAEGETDGCVVIDVHESPLAPHRLEAGERHCFIRRADRSEKMTMREIQDLTIDRLRGTERANARLQELVDGVHEERRVWLRMHIVATPTTAKISLPWNTELAGITPVLRQYRSHEDQIEHSVPVQGFNPPRPVLRGWRWEDGRRHPLLTYDVYWDGSVVARFDVPERDDNRVLYPGWVVAHAANALNTIDRVRGVGGQPDAEYAFKFGLQAHRPLQLLRYGAREPAIDAAGQLVSPFDPPVYSAASRDSFGHLVDELQRDLFNAIGVAADDINLGFDQ